jgi:gliding motility-associated-like protein
MDQNASETYTYSIQNGLYNANMFQIVNNQLQFIGNVNPTIGQYQVGISAYDGSQWTIDSVFTISVENTNIQPTEIQISNLNITDTIQSGNLVGNLSVMDQNASETYTYSIQNGLYNANMFQIVNNQLQFIGNVNPTIGQYQVGISAYDGSQWTIDSVFTISVENTNIQPTQIQLSNLQITDQNQVLDMVGELSVIDPNQENYTYTINPLVLNGNMFQIVDNKIQVASTINPLAGQYQVEVSAYDGRLWTIDSVFTISVVNTNAKPTEIKLSNSVIYDHSSSGFEVGNLSVEDTNSNEEYAYTIKSGLDAQEFQLVDNSLQFVGVVDLSKAEYKVTINAYDGRLWNIDSVFTISVNNTNSQPTEMMISNSIITNNNQVGDSIASFNVIDADNDSYSYTLSQDLDGDKFNLVGKTLILLEEFNPSESKYHIKINAYDGKQHSIDSVFTLTLENNNQTPTSLELDHFEIDENAAKGTLIGYLSTEDDDNEHTYSLSFNNGDNDNSNFSINGNAIYSAKTFDYENQSEYSIEVTVSDKVGNKLSSNFDIQINDIIEIDHIEANNYLTPNGDGQNDYWEVENVELYKDYTLKIFNKQGQVVFEKNQDYNNDWSAENLPSGVYYYFLTSNSSSIEFSGVIHLVK